MTQETIEKAAKENASTHFGLINKEWWARKNGFEDGARWRINSVWHNKHTVIPEVGRTALLELKDPNTHKIVYKIDTYCGEEWRGLTHYEHSGLVRFAYLDDLLLQRKEEVRYEPKMDR